MLEARRLRVYEPDTVRGHPYIVVGIYGDRLWKTQQEALSPQRRAIAECSLRRPVTNPKNTVHSAPRPVGQLESTFISWYVMIGQRNYKSNMVGELPYDEFPADHALYAAFFTLPEDFHTLVRHPTHFNETSIF